MSEKAGEIYYEISARMADFEKALAASNSRVGELEKTMKSSSAKITQSNNSIIGSFTELKSKFDLITGAARTVYNVISKFTEAASNLNEQESKFNIVFAKSQEKAKAAVDELGTSYGMSRREAMDYMAQIKSMLVPMGLADSKTTDMSIGITKLASDMASFNNIPMDVAFEKIRSGLSGEVEPLRSVGVFLNENTVAEKAYAAGIAKRGQELTDVQKVQARWLVVLDQTKLAQGDMIRTGDSWANTQRKMNAQLEDGAAIIGSAMVPSLQKMGQAFMNANIKRFAEDVSLGIGTLTRFAGIIEEIRSASNTSIPMTFSVDLKFNTGMFGSASGPLGLIKTAYEKVNAETGIMNKRIGEQALDVYLGAATDESKLAKEFRQFGRDASAGNIKALEFVQGQVKDWVQQNDAKAIKYDPLKVAPKASGELQKLRKEWDEIGKDFANGWDKITEKTQKAMDLNDAALKAGVVKAVEYTERYSEIVKQSTEDKVKEITKYTTAVLSSASQLAQQFGQIMQQMSQNQMQHLETQKTQYASMLEYNYQQQLTAAGLSEDSDRSKNQKTLAALRAAYDKETSIKKKAALAEQIREKEKAESKYQIDENYQQQKNTLETIMEFRRVQMARNAARQQQQISIFSATVNTLSAAMAAFNSLASIPYVGFALGIAAAIATLAFGFAQVGIIASTPLPAYAKGGVADTPSIFGEAGTEIAVPLTGAAGRAAIALLADGLVNAIAEKTGATDQANSGPIVRGEEQVASSATAQMISGDVYLDSAKVGTWLSRQTANGAVRIDKRSVV